MNFWYEDHRILVYLNLSQGPWETVKTIFVVGYYTQRAALLWLSRTKKRKRWELHEHICTYVHATEFYRRKQSGLPVRRRMPSFEIYNYPPVKENQGKKIMQGKPIYLFSSTESLSVFVIGGCQHYDRVSSRYNWRRHFPWWVWSSQTGKDAVGLLHIHGVQSLGLTSQTGFHRGKRKTALWTLGMWRCIQPENHLSLLPASSWHWLPMPFLLMKTGLGSQLVWVGFWVWLM